MVVPARSEKSEQALQTDLEGLTHTGRLDVVRCSVGDEASCDVFRDHVKEKCVAGGGGRLRVVVWTVARKHMQAYVCVY